MSSWHIGSVYKPIKGFVGNVLNVYMTYETMKGLAENIPNLKLDHRV
jgi:hypothetical protein